MQTAGKLLHIQLLSMSVILVMVLALSSCQFQPLYETNDNTISGTNTALSQIAVSEVTTRQAQQVRNHLIFLLSGGTVPLDPRFDLKLRVTSNTNTLASAIANSASNQIGNTAGSVKITVSYDLYDRVKKQIVHRGARTSNASFDKTSQSFASDRAIRDAENRAAKSVAEQLRLALSSNLANVR